MLFSEERQEQIVELLVKKQKVTVEELSKVFSVSPVTIRKDLKTLEDNKRLVRAHGGAILRKKASFEPKTFDKEVVNIELKEKIALLASHFVEDGDTLALDSGSTTMELAKKIASVPNLTIVTNDLRIINYMEYNSSAQLMLMGGVVRKGINCTTGPITIQGIRQFSVDKCFMAAESFSLEKGFTTPSVNQSEWKENLMRTATELYMLMDSTKIGKVSFKQFATMDQFDYFITDDEIDKKALRDFKTNYPKVEIHIG